ncbi:MAG: hypothetical protein N3G21_12105 [Candidatus Hydrogenedentes bacterium]|nr:hypothetical protein [Candidatus Hydrogenedentota bacterium]
MRYICCFTLILSYILLINLRTFSENLSINDFEAILIEDNHFPLEPQNTALKVLVEEIERRTAVKIKVSNRLKEGGIIVLSTWRKIKEVTKGKKYGAIREFKPEEHGRFSDEGYILFVDKSGDRLPILWIIGYDHRGILFGVGKLLRIAEFCDGKVSIPHKLCLVSSPISPIRGHQLGYRARANSYDAWDVPQYEKYIRELAFFGNNSVENIPFQDEQFSPHMKVPRREMNKAISQICKIYGLDYWVWVPADFDLRDSEKRENMLRLHKELYSDCPEITGVFFPGGDPGDNPPELVIPFLEDLSRILLPIHPKASIWLSLQGFSPSQSKYVFDYLRRERPKWFGGICEGPSSPPIAYLRKELPDEYRLRMYPDITHNKLCQYPVPWWDLAFALTHGREGINPRPVQYAYIHNWFQPYCDGFITYSDGIHDDVNKVVWSASGWDPSQNVREILYEYCNVFFGTGIAELAVEGILALEKNWRGPAIDNGSIEGTLLIWQKLEEMAPKLKDNWRWQLCLVRAYYDAYVRRRLVYETKLEGEASEILINAKEFGSERAIDMANGILLRAITEPVAPDLRKKIEKLFDDLFKSIGLQSSVEKYGASGGERGASLDYLDIPLNNRWWLEDEFVKISNLHREEEKLKRLCELGKWEKPGYGSFYDDVGNTAKSPRIKRCEAPVTNPAEEAWPEPTLWWFEEGKSRKRLSWLSSLEEGEALYQGLNPDKAYRVSFTGYGIPQIFVDGEKVSKEDEKILELGEVRSYAIPQEAVEDREIVLKWRLHPSDFRKNWRQRSRICEIWLICEN